MKLSVDKYEIPSESELMKLWTSTSLESYKPVITIICLNYNHELSLKRCLNSILTQQCDQPFEILINDDFSTDNSREILNYYSREYPNVIKLILQDENRFQKGAGSSMFLDLVNMANGKYICYCECDDYWTDKNKLQFQRDFLESNESCYMHIMDEVGLYTCDDVFER